jgi:hypothetical protein
VLTDNNIHEMFVREPQRAIQIPALIAARANIPLTVEGVEPVAFVGFVQVGVAAAVVTVVVVVHHRCRPAGLAAGASGVASGNTGAASGTAALLRISDRIFSTRLNATFFAPCGDWCLRWLCRPISARRNRQPSLSVHDARRCVAAAALAHLSAQVCLRATLG